jgi:hypothetical protein
MSLVSMDASRGPLTRFVDFLASCLDRGLLICRGVIRSRAAKGSLVQYFRVSGHVVLSLRYPRRYLHSVSQGGDGVLAITYASVLGRIDSIFHGKSHAIVASRQFLCRSHSTSCLRLILPVF